ncbi:nitroreductase family protein|nr:nitroreductase family protein [archaeon]
MDAVKAVMTRRSIRKYKKKDVPKKLIMKLIDAARQAPSAYNDQPWEFIVVKNKETMKKITKYKSKFMLDAPVWIFCGYNKNKSSTEHDLENTALAIENLLITAHAMGLGAVYTGGYDPGDKSLEKAISKALNLPKNVHIVSIVCVGWPDEEPGEKEMRPLSNMTHFETF